MQFSLHKKELPWNQASCFHVDKATTNNGYNSGENNILSLYKLQPTEPCLSCYYPLFFSWYLLAASQQVSPTLMTHDADSRRA